VYFFAYYYIIENLQFRMQQASNELSSILSMAIDDDDDDDDTQ
jgi:hypothetical protein